MLIVRPIGGLCNRLRTIESTYKLALAAGVALKVIWDIDNHSLHAPFNSLFHPIKDIVVIDNYIDSKIKRVLFEIDRFFLSKRNFFVSENFLANTLNEKWSKEKMKVFFETKAKSEDLFVESCWDFYPIERTFRLFKPIYSIQNKIDTYSRNFSENIIGVHIRRTDHTTAIEASPIELFVDKINAILRECSYTKFFLATDDKEVESYFLTKFEKNLIIYSRNKSRLADAGVEDAVIDLFLLSKTNKILGTFWSSFSLSAAELGGIELEVISNKTL